MAKKVTAMVKLQLPAGKATPGPPVGSTLGPYGINIPGFTKEFNAKTANEVGLIILRKIVSFDMLPCFTPFVNGIIGFF